MSDAVIRKTEAIEDGAIVRLSGDIDLSRSPELRNGLLEIAGRQPQRLIVDLTDVGYMDSSGVATLVEALQHQRRHEGRVILFGLTEKVRSIFEIARLDMVFTIVEDADAARTA